MVGSKAYLIGGRGNKQTDIYDPVSRKWSVGKAPPIQLHHMVSQRSRTFYLSLICMCGSSHSLTLLFLTPLFLLSAMCCS